MDDFKHLPLPHRHQEPPPHHPPPRAEAPAPGIALLRRETPSWPEAVEWDREEWEGHF